MRALAFVLLLTGSGCTSSRMRTTSAALPGGGRFDEARLLRWTAHGTTAPIEVLRLDVDRDVTRWMDADGRPHTLATDSIHAVAVTRRFPILGAAIGLAAGTVFGGYAARRANRKAEDEECQGPCLDPGPAVAAGGLSLMGSIFGLTAGALVTHTRRYVVNAAPPR